MIFIEHNSLKSDMFLTLFRMGFFGAAHGSGGAFVAPLLKIGHTYPTMMKLGTDIPYLRKILRKTIFTFLESLVIVLINMVTILMMSAKISTPGLLKIRVF